MVEVAPDWFKGVVGRSEVCYVESVSPSCFKLGGLTTAKPRSYGEKTDFSALKLIGGEAGFATQPEQWSPAESQTIFLKQGRWGKMYTGMLEGSAEDFIGEVSIQVEFLLEK